jgi:hypothetical protein
MLDGARGGSAVAGYLVAGAISIQALRRQFSPHETLPWR